MLKALKHIRSGLALLKPDEIHRRAVRPVHIGLVAATDSGYAGMEDFLVPGAARAGNQPWLTDSLHRAGDPDVPAEVDLVLYDQGIPRPSGAYTYYRDRPEETIAEILRDNDDLALPLARRFPAFRTAVVESTIHAISRENAFFAVATALPDVIPSLAELPWVVGEFASDTAFLTGNQIRMAFLIAAACGSKPGYSRQKLEIASIAAGAFGWRAVARELVGKIPFGGGLIPKGAIAYAGTFVVGKALERLHHGHKPYTPRERAEVYGGALERGKSIVQPAASVQKPEVSYITQNPEE